MVVSNVIIPVRKNFLSSSLLQAASYLGIQGFRAYVCILLSNKIMNHVQDMLYLDFIFFFLQKSWNWWW